MRLRTIRAGRGVTITSAVLAAVLTGTVTGGVAAHAVPRPAGAARLAATTGTTPATTPAGGTADGTADGARPALARFGAAPTAALHRQAGAPAGTTVVSVRFRPGVRAASAAAAAPLALGRRAATAVTRSVAPRTNAATYSVPSADADAFLTAMRTRGDVLDASPEVFARYDTTPNDPLFHTTATTDRDQYSYLKDISLVSGWTLRGSAAVKIAIVDSGIDVGHPDLSAKIAAEDRYNAVTTTTNVTDTVGHGTFVAGVAGASTNNGVGIAGVGWSAKLMAVKVADATGGLALTDIAEGITWAADHGAKVINVSLGATAGTTLLADAVAYAQAQGAIVVASAGNSAQEGNPRIYPAAYPGVIAVGATDGPRNRAWFSEHGSWVTMAAPGVRIVSTTVRAGSTFWPAGSYNVGDGTSFAAPVVAGTAALVWSRTPDATAGQVRSAVVRSGQGFKGYGLGTGRVTVAAAMGVLPPAVLPTIVSPLPGQTLSSLPVLEATTNDPGAHTHWYLDGEALPGYSTTGTGSVVDLAGWALGAHTIEARNCSGTNVCPGSGTSIPVTLQDTAPVLFSPVDGDTVTGEVTVSTTGTASRIAIYEGSTRLALGSFGVDTRVNFTGRDGTHALQAVVCDREGLRCDGARSEAVTVTSASAAVSGGTVTEPLFTPNGDGVRDETSMTYTTASTQDVTVSVVREGSDVAVRTFPTLVQRPAGAWSGSWDGLDDAGQAVGDGRYTIRVATVDASGRAGLVTGSTVIDITRPAFGFGAVPALLFYPVADGYQDTFRPQVNPSEASVLTFVVKNAAGAVRRTVTKSVSGVGTTSVTWDGKDDAGRPLPSGTYSWTVRATDAAGLSFSSRARDITLSPQRLTTRTTTRTYAGTTAWGVNSGPACAKVTATGSSYASGVWLKNTCAKGSTGTSALHFHTRMPGAKKYLAWRLRTTGRSHSAPVDVYGGLMNGFTNTYDISGPDVRVPTGATTTRTLDLGRVSEAGSRGTTFDVAVFVQNSRLAPLTDWDLKSVSVTVSYQVLA